MHWEKIKEVEERTLPWFDFLTKRGTTVGASSLPQGKTEQDPNWEEKDGAENSQASKGVFQYTNSARDN